MARKLLIRTDQFPYHVTTRSRNKDWYDLPMNDVWEIYMKAFEKALSKHPVKIHAFVLMSNHYHLLLTTIGQNIDQFMREFNQSVSLSIRLKTKRINQIFGSRYRWSIVQNENYLNNIYRYIFRNPVEAGICRNCEDYRYSSISSFPWPLTELVEINTQEFKNWINSISDENEYFYIKKGLQKKIFSPPKNPSTKKKIQLPSFNQRSPY